MYYYGCGVWVGGGGGERERERDQLAINHNSTCYHCPH